MHFNKYTLVELFTPTFTLYWIITHFSIIDLAVLYGVVLFIHTHTTAFMHRAWAHRAWIPNKWLTIYALILLNLALAGASPAWCAIHREHHRFADTERDPHSPDYKPAWRLVFFQNMTPDFAYSKDLIQDPVHRWFQTHYWTIAGVWLIALAIVNVQLFLFWCAVIGLHRFLMNLLNIVGHKNFKPVNSPVLAWFYLQGETWHANHHYNQKNWRFGRNWKQIDLGAVLIRLFVALRLAKAR